MTTVIKVGGSVRDPEALLREIAATDEPVVVVHGASRVLDEVSTRLGNPPRMVESGRGDVTRYTDSTTMDHFLMAYAGLRNKRIVERLRQLGVDAIGLTGLDAGIAIGRRRRDLRIVADGRQYILHDNHAGAIERVDASLLQVLLERGCTPVLTPPISAEDGTAINVDGDRLAADVAIAMHASTLVFFADTPGVLADPADADSVLPRIDADAAASFAGRVRPKVQAALRAGEGGVPLVVVAGACAERPLHDALQGAGTRVSATSAAARRFFARR